jgi:Undecaprenyl-phosphate galactose phosphotransferase WbaP
MVFPSGHPAPATLTLLPLIPIWIAVSAWFRLYPGFGSSNTDDLRDSWLTLVVTFGIYVVGRRLLDPSWTGIFLWVLAWAVSSMIAVPVARRSLKAALGAARFWGRPVAILGAAKTARLVLDTLKRHPAYGYVPVAVLDDDNDRHGEVLHGITVTGPVERVHELQAHYRDLDLIVAMPGAPRERLVALVNELSLRFRRVLVIPDLFGLKVSEVRVRGIDNALTIEVENQLLGTHNRIIKRGVDLLLCTLSLPLTLPLMAVIAVLVRLDSAGPVLYRDRRTGLNLQPFYCLKFRTMHTDAAVRLKAVLDADPALAAEFKRYHKLADDPRLTRVGRFLRATSLDELPQIFNVFRGEMSLVGPRPEPFGSLAATNRDQDPAYTTRLRYNYSTLPGITGLWQVSGRSELSFDERLELESQYLKNWSVWLDLVILARTPFVVLARLGAR